MRNSLADRAMHITPGALLAAALGILVLPLKWCLAFLAAAGIHELGHCLAVFLLRGHMDGMTVGARGARLTMAPMGAWREAVCLLAGPVAGAAAMFLYPVFPRVAICAGIQTFWNLLPVETLDGGRILSCLARMVLPPPKAERVCRWTGGACRGLALGLGVWAVLAHLGILPLLLAMALLATKTACKRAESGVQ